MVLASSSLADLADRDLEQQLIAKLRGLGLPALRRLSVEVHSGVVTVRGQVRSFYEKQLAQHSYRLSNRGGRQLIDLVIVSD